MTELYPLKFDSILKEKMWGGHALVSYYNKEGDPHKHYGESWELSGVQDNLSMINNGFLQGNNIEELIEVYMGDLVGDAIYEKFGIEFPLLIKIIEANDDLSIQVHPDNELALKRHNAYGKTEMWYILETEEGAKIYSGFNKQYTKEEYLEAVKSETLPSMLCAELSSPGDVFFTPAGKVHAIGAGNILMEIQQTSDITYRISDWGRVDANGKSRPLHTDLAVDAIDFSTIGSGKKTSCPHLDRPEKIADCEFFTVNLQWIITPVEKNYMRLDSFVIFFCIEGEFSIKYNGDKTETVKKGETVLLPAILKEVVIEPNPEAKYLEIYIKK